MTDDKSIPEWIKTLLNKPKIIGIVANQNEGKTNTLHYIVDIVKDKAKLYSFGFNSNHTIAFNSVEEMENIQNSIIMIDEFEQLFNLQDRHKDTIKILERIFRTVTHPRNNNIIILSGLGNNYNKFISSRLDSIIFKKLSYDMIVNGSKVKKAINMYRDVGYIKGSTQLNLGKDELLIYDNYKYSVENVKYMSITDTKKDNKDIVKW